MHEEILCRKIDKGFTFPLNLKWVLCAAGRQAGRQDGSV